MMDDELLRRLVSQDDLFMQRLVKVEALVARLQVDVEKLSFVIEGLSGGLKDE